MKRLFSKILFFFILNTLLFLYSNGNVALNRLILIMIVFCSKLKANVFIKEQNGR